MSARAVAGPRARLTPRAAILAVLVLVLAMALVVPLRQYFAQRSEIEALERRVEQLIGERRALEDRIDQLHDPDYLERLARECLGMVRPGEIVFVPVPEDGAAAPERC